MIPQLVEIEGAPYAVLPPGVHEATLEELRDAFAINPRRQKLFDGIAAVARTLSAAGCTVMYLGGSYVTAKPNPSDFDGCWDPKGVDAAALDPVLLDFDDGRRVQKAKFGGEMFIATFPATATADVVFMNFFQIEKTTGKEKGIIKIKLGIV